MKLNRVTEGHYTYKEWKLFKTKYRTLGDNKERVLWKTYHNDRIVMSFSTLKEAKEYIANFDKEESIEQ